MVDIMVVLPWSWSIALAMAMVLVEGLGLKWNTLWANKVCERCQVRDGGRYLHESWWKLRWLPLEALVCG